MEYDQCWKKKVCGLFSLLARCKDVFVPNCLPKVLSPQKQRIWLWSRWDRHNLMTTGGAWTHSCPLSRFTGAQASRSYHGFAKGTRCKQRMWPSSRLSHSSHFRCSHLRMPFFFPRRILCSSASLKIMMRICLPFIIMVFHNIAHQQCSSMYWYEVTLLWICI